MRIAQRRTQFEALAHPPTRDVEVSALEVEGRNAHQGISDRVCVTNGPKTFEGFLEEGRGLVAVAAPQDLVEGDIRFHDRGSTHVSGCLREFQRFFVDALGAHPVVERCMCGGPRG